MIAHPDGAGLREKRSTAAPAIAIEHRNPGRARVSRCGDAEVPNGALVPERIALKGDCALEDRQSRGCARVLEDSGIQKQRDDRSRGFSMRESASRKIPCARGNWQSLCRRRTVSRSRRSA